MAPKKRKAPAKLDKPPAKKAKLAVITDKKNVVFLSNDCLCAVLEFLNLRVLFMDNIPCASKQFYHVIWTFHNLWKNLNCPFPVNPKQASQDFWLKVAAVACNIRLLFDPKEQKRISYTWLEQACAKMTNAQQVTTFYNGVVKHLENIVKLQELNLIADVESKNCHFPHVHTLTMQSNLKDALAACPQVSTLVVTGIANVIPRFPNTLTGLVSVLLEKCNMDQEMWNILTELKQLKHLRLHDCTVTKVGIVVSKNEWHLETIDIRNTSINISTLLHQQVVHFTYVNQDVFNIIQPMKAFIKSLTHVKTVIFGNEMNKSRGGYFSGGFPDRMLDLTGCLSDTIEHVEMHMEAPAKFLEYLATLPNLKTIVMFFGNEKAPFASAFGGYSKSVKHLSLDGIHNHDWRPYVFKYFPNITYLSVNVGRTPSLGELLLHSHQFKFLQELDLKYNYDETKYPLHANTKVTKLFRNSNQFCFNPAQHYLSIIASFPNAHIYENGCEVNLIPRIRKDISWPSKLDSYLQEHTELWIPLFKLALYNKTQVILPAAEEEAILNDVQEKLTSLSEKDIKTLTSYIKDLTASLTTTRRRNK